MSPTYLASSEPSTTRSCLNCGTVVTQSYARVFGDNQNRVLGCQDCQSSTERRRAREAAPELQSRVQAMEY